MRNKRGATRNPPPPILSGSPQTNPMTRIAEGLHVEDVGYGEYVDAVVRPGNIREKRVAVKSKHFQGEMKKSLIWQPHGDNWLANAMMGLLTKNK